MSDFKVPHDIQVWAKYIGGFVINFGSMEMLSCVWIERMAGRNEGNKARKREVLSERIERVIQLIPASTLKQEQKVKSLSLWKEAREYCRTRNRIVHNPLNFSFQRLTGHEVLTIHDMRKINPLESEPIQVLNATEIKDIAIRVKDIVLELNSIIHSIK